MDSITIYNDALVPFMAKVRQRSGTTGRSLRGREGEIEIAFYDLGTPGLSGEPGRFVCSYYASTIADVEGPLALYLGIDRWTLDPAACSMVSRWIRSDLLAAGLSSPSGDKTYA